MKLTQPEPTNEQRLDRAWREGILDWKLRPAQLKLESIFNRPRSSLKLILNCARRLGKSFWLFKKACESAIRRPQFPVRYAAPTAVALRKIVLPIARRFLLNCPPQYKPVWISSERMYRFPKILGSGEIHFSGCNNGHAENLRGTEAGLAIIDEAGFVDDLKYVVDDILMPQLLTTDGQLILSSSPPRTPAHPYVKFVEEAQAEDCYAELDIYQAGYPPEKIAQFMKEAGGEKSTTWQREYLCQFVVDSLFALVPEWDHKQWILDWPRTEMFRFYHLYEAMDIGGIDKTVVLFGYYDFRAAKVIVEDEVVLDKPGMTSQKIAALVKEREKTLYGGRTIYKRVADNNNVILLNDLGSMYDLHFQPTGKDNLEAMVGEVRIWVNSGKLIVHPRCKQLTGCLRFGVWAESAGRPNRKKFGRSEAYGHFDAFAALVYLIRNLDVHVNPIPADFQLSPQTHWINPQVTETQNSKALKQIVGLKRRR